MTNRFDLTGKTFLVTGSSSGIGKATAIHIAELGGKVILTGRNKIKLSSVLEELSGTDHKICEADLLNELSTEKLIRESNALDGIVISSGVMGLYPAKFLDEKKLIDFMEINYLKPVSLVLSLIKAKKLNKGSSIVFITSINGSVVGSSANSAYGASKGALHSFSKALALDMGKQQIRVNCIAPGMIETEGFEEIEKTVSAESIAEDRKKYPLGRYGKPSDVANACTFLLSQASNWITGTTLIVDGGFTAQ